MDVAAVLQSIFCNVLTEFTARLPHMVTQVRQALFLTSQLAGFQLDSNLQQYDAYIYSM